MATATAVSEQPVELTPAQRRRAKERAYAKRFIRSTTEKDHALIEELPPVQHADRKAMCRYDLLLFAQWYFPDSTGLGPFSDDHVGMLDRMQHSIIHGGKDVNCVYREFGRVDNRLLLLLLSIAPRLRRNGKRTRRPHRQDNDWQRQA